MSRRGSRRRESEPEPQQEPAEEKAPEPVVETKSGSRSTRKRSSAKSDSVAVEADAPVTVAGIDDAVSPSKGATRPAKRSRGSKQIEVSVAEASPSVKPMDTVAPPLLPVQPELVDAKPDHVVAMNSEESRPCVNTSVPSASETDGRSNPKSLSMYRGVPTFRDLQEDEFAVMARRYWLPSLGSGDDGASLKASRLDPFSADAVRRLYIGVCSAESVGAGRLALLELSQALELFLWPNFDGNHSTLEHILLITMIINEKFRLGILDPWAFIDSFESRFSDFMLHLLLLLTDGDLSLTARTTVVIFLIRAFQNLERPAVRSCCLRWLSLPLWSSLSAGRRLQELEVGGDRVRQAWAMIESEPPSDEKDPWKFIDRTCFTKILSQFFQVLFSLDVNMIGREDAEQLVFCERVLEWILDLLSQLTIRRFVRPLLSDCHLVVRCREAPVVSSPVGRLFTQLLDMVTFYEGFEVDDHTGEALTESQRLLCHYNDVKTLQVRAFALSQDDSNGAFSPDGFAALRSVALANVASIDTAEGLMTHLKSLSDADLHSFAASLYLVSPSASYTRRFLEAVLCHRYQRRCSEIDRINALPLYPSESILWNEHLIPARKGPVLPAIAGTMAAAEIDASDSCLALPKLNLQFLTPHDYLLRNYDLFRYESAYEIRDDVEDVVQRMTPRKVAAGGDLSGSVLDGWARMGSPICGFRVTKVGVSEVAASPPRPARVEAEILLDLHPTALKGSRRLPSLINEWSALRQHDILFLIGAESAASASGDPHYVHDRSLPFAQRYNVRFVRGCEVLSVMDKDGRAYTGQGGRDDQELSGRWRILRVLLDSNQYRLDDAQGIAATIYGGPLPSPGARPLPSLQRSLKETSERLAPTDLNRSSFNILMRRKPKENNFKSVLSCIRALMNVQFVLPLWLHEVFLGYGDPAGAHYLHLLKSRAIAGGKNSAKSLVGKEIAIKTTLDFADTFLDVDHALEALGGEELWIPLSNKVASKQYLKRSVTVEQNGVPIMPPFQITFETMYYAKDDRRRSPERVGEETVTIRSYLPPAWGPYPTDEPRRNTIRFTSKQTEAICSGMNPGLTLVVGPPGTGKTDTAVQIVSLLYRTWTQERILIVTHSNSALNDLFSKIQALDLDEGRLLRLGHGEDSLCSETGKDFSKFGRVNYVLQRRLDRLTEVQRLAEVLNVAAPTGDASTLFTCETAQHFFSYHVVGRWEEFAVKCREYQQSHKGDYDGSFISTEFPFLQFFNDAPQPLFPASSSWDACWRIAEGCMTHIRKVFSDLEDYRPMELLRRGTERGNYLLTKHARVVAMTCTHAAIKREELAEELRFQFDTLIMEEAAQVLEIETFIPMLLQNPDPSQPHGCRLKRLVLIGDHNQLPPVVKGLAFQKFSKMDQSLFTRLVRLGVPTVDLDKQGRMRSCLADLYRWRYKSLGDLPLVNHKKLANPGLAHVAQIINVADYEGQGETAPTPYFYQNLGEAEAVVALFMYMRLLGYPADRITILTPYNGQKHLIRDVVGRRCAAHPMLGSPSKVTTVDRFQGQQNDYILVSMVRTRSVGHVRDVRRLVVMASRARLGLYVFCRLSLFTNCLELRPTISLLLKRAPSQLQLVAGVNEAYGNPLFSRGEDASLEKLGLEVTAVSDVTHLCNIVNGIAALRMMEATRGHGLFC